MDPLYLLEAACKSARSVVRWGFGYGRQLRDAWEEARVEADMVARSQAAVEAMEAADERARQRLVEREEAEEVAEGLHAAWAEDDEPDAWADYDYTPRKRTPSKCTKCDGDMILRHVCVEPAVGAPTPNPPTAAAVPPAAAVGTTPGEYAAVAVLEVLAEHQWFNAAGRCGCGPRSETAITDHYDYREHVAAEVARRINAAAADARVTDRLDAAGFAKNTFEQHQKPTK